MQRYRRMAMSVQVKLTRVLKDTVLREMDMMTKSYNVANDKLA